MYAQYHCCQFVCMHNITAVSLYVCTVSLLSVCMYAQNHCFQFVCMHSITAVSLYVCTVSLLSVCMYAQNHCFQFVCMHSITAVSLYVCTESLLSVCMYAQYHCSDTVCFHVKWSHKKNGYQSISLKILMDWNHVLNSEHRNKFRNIDQAPLQINSLVIIKVMALF